MQQWTDGGLPSLFLTSASWVYYYYYYLLIVFDICHYYYYLLIVFDICQLGLFIIIIILLIDVASRASSSCAWYNHQPAQNW
jgi:hypothetical protein